MRAVTIKDKQLTVEEHPDPVPGSGEVLIKVHAAGLNGADMMQLGGHYPAPPGSPQDIPGLELAGEVVDRGPGAERFAVGDRVMSIVGGGGWSVSGFFTPSGPASSSATASMCGVCGNMSTGRTLRRM